HPAQGDFPHIVTAPADLRETYQDIFSAFNWADRYQMPIIVLSDKKLASVYTTIDKLELKYDKIDRGERFTGSEWTAADAKGTILDAIRVLEAQGKQINFLQCRLMKPFPAEAVGNILRKAKRIVSMEENYSGQLASLVTEHTGVLIKDRINKYDGRPFSEDEVVRALTNAYAGGKAEAVVTHVRQRAGEAHDHGLQVR